MGQSLRQVPFYVSEVPEFEPRGECIRIEWRGIEVFVPIPVCQAAIGRCNRALDQWHDDKGIVLPFRRSAPVAAE
jgi:hypothetical protein